MPINIQQMRRELTTPIKALSNLAYGAALSSFSAKKKAVIDKVVNHKVSQEISAGNAADSFYLPKGNLFSLLGFFEKDKPIDDLKEFLKDELYVKNSPISLINGNRISYDFPVFIPTEKQIRAATPLTWDASKSWIEEIEGGVSGFTNYLFHRFFTTPSSRSKSGLQSKRFINNNADFSTPIPYLSQILEDLEKELR